MKTPCLALLLLTLCSLASAAEPLRISVLGDSLTAGYGLAARDAFPAQLERALQQQGLNVRVSNAGVSGDTSTGGLARLSWALQERPALMIIELGANDALRGLDPQQTYRNLQQIVTTLQKAAVRPLLTGMKAPRSLGRDYYSKFDALYPRLADEQQLPFYPFFLQGVAGRQELNQADGIHPNPQGVKRIVKGILPLLVKTLRPLLP